MSGIIEAGSVLRGKYRIERVLGVGGMGAVFAAWHERLAQRVAIKVLLSAMLQHPGVLHRFQREAQAASRIRSDHVARVSDVDALEDGVPFMVMEYLDGRDLSSTRGIGLEHEVAVEYVLQACDAIAEAHSLGIIHRDLKPANLFLTRTREGKPCIKVLDFGISKLGGPDDPSSASVTKTTGVLGSAEYMSPEQMLSTRDVDVRTDIWALGVTLYELCTGQVPFPGGTLAQVCALVMSQEPSPPRRVRPRLPEGLERVILRCLSKDREKRFPNIAEFVLALAPFAGARSVEMVAKLAHATGSALHSAPSAHATATVVLPGASSTLVLPSDPSTRSAAQMASATTELGGVAPIRRSIATTSGGATADHAAGEPTGRPIAPMVAAVVVVLGALGGGTLWFTQRGAARPSEPLSNGAALAALGPSTTAIPPSPSSLGTAPVAMSSAIPQSPTISLGGEPPTIPALPSKAPASPLSAGSAPRTPNPTHSIPTAPPANTRRDAKRSIL